MREYSTYEEMQKLSRLKELRDTLQRAIPKIINRESGTIGLEDEAVFISVLNRSEFIPFEFEDMGWNEVIDTFNAIEERSYAFQQELRNILAQHEKEYENQLNLLVDIGVHNITDYENSSSSELWKLVVERAREVRDFECEFDLFIHNYTRRHHGFDDRDLGKFSSIAEDCKDLILASGEIKNSVGYHLQVAPEQIGISFNRNISHITGERKEIVNVVYHNFEKDLEVESSETDFGGCPHSELLAIALNNIESEAGLEEGHLYSLCEEVISTLSATDDIVQYVKDTELYEQHGIKDLNTSVKMDFLRTYAAKRNNQELSFSEVGIHGNI